MTSITEWVGAVGRKARGVDRDEAATAGSGTTPQEGAEPSLFRCPDCETVYVAIDKRTCATCETDVEAIDS